MCKCLECGGDFTTEKGLSAHVKAHKMSVAEYYTKHWPRFSAATGEPIIFKNSEDYKHAYFNSRVEMRRWFKKVAQKGSADQKKTASSIGVEMIARRIQEKDLAFIPCEFELSTVNTPTLSILLKINPNFKSDLKENFTFQLEGLLGGRADGYFVDTREQQPWELPNSIVTKLEIGDYAASGKFFSNIFVDRKSDGDFLSTFTSGIERFERELQRAIKHDASLIVVSEADLNGLYKKCQVFGSKNTMELALSNCRELLAKYPRKIQFVLCSSRDMAREITMDILGAGEAAKTMDWQFLLNNYNK